MGETRENARRNKTTIRQVLGNRVVLRRLVYLVLLMTAFNWMSHGTQDIYPTFLKEGLAFSPNTALYIAMLYNVGALIGGTLMGAASEKYGRRAIVVLRGSRVADVWPRSTCRSRSGWRPATATPSRSP
jgi:MFS transporter, SHS family, lactate transporter